ncbi:phosphoribosylanthranilate isomerase [Aquirufa sp.]|jgi:phosphoribosylanthranilate isomerase|uniref:phosphoribosylanthranilate isomerase n=1 Tax=Aquirufa sp. TaxID=2676249 RepID=UPI0037C10A27
MMKWKVCGMRDLKNIEAVAACEPDYMGFIWVSKSPRYVGADFVIPNLPAKTKAVGVFVNESTANILALSKKAGFQVVQLHGDEGQEVIDELQAAGLLVIKAVSVGTEQDVNGLDLLPDYYLFDTKKGSQVGGTGERFDWSILEVYKLNIPYFLAGGLEEASIKEAKQLPGLYALDFNSKLELSPGLKDLAKVKDIMQNI